MPQSYAHPAPIPSQSIIHSTLDRVDYSDAFRLTLPKGATHTIDAVAKQVFLMTPKWISALMRLRDAIVSVIGLKTSPVTEIDLNKITLIEGNSIGLFQVLKRNDSEIIFGENDKHLDFRAGLLLQKTDHGDEVIFSTLVRFNGWLGKLYFLPVKPFHKLVVPSLLNRLRK